MCKKKWLKTSCMPSVPYRDGACLTFRLRKEGTGEFFSERREAFRLGGDIVGKFLSPLLESEAGSVGHGSITMATRDGKWEWSSTVQYLTPAPHQQERAERPQTQGRIAQCSFQPMGVLH